MTTVQRGSSGYTIVETMIFLAVSGALFLVGVLVVGGQQSKTEFSTAVRDFDSKLQSVMGNVASGYYNNPGTVTCQNSAGAPDPQPSGPVEQGQSSDCTFIGQWIELVAPNDEDFDITSYAGLRLRDGTDEEVRTLDEATPRPITSTTETYELPGGLTASMRVRNGVLGIRSLAITTTFAQQGSDGLVSGASRVQLHAIEGSLVRHTNPPDGVQICITDGGQVGVIQLNTSTTAVTIRTLNPPLSVNPCTTP